jgi:hypothetical protein
MATILFPPDFKEFLQLLNFHKVRYLLIGGYAVGYYGYPRATADIDIWISNDKENIEKIIQVLNKFGFPDVPTDVLREENKIIRMGVPPLRIELLTGISGVRFEECYSRKIVAAIDEMDISIISINDLKENKKASGRYKDLNDLENLA